MSPATYQLEAICIGKVRSYTSETPISGKNSWTTAFHKSPLHTPALFAQDKVTGDEQGDRRHHGGRENAVLAYSIDHHAAWKKKYGVDEIPFGAFGENLSVRGATDSDVCVGDVWKIGSVKLVVTKPRQPCSTFARCWSRPDLVEHVIATRSGGWYLRILVAGSVQAPHPIELIERPSPKWTIARLMEAFYERKDDRQLSRELAELETLPTSWREIFAKRI